MKRIEALECQPNCGHSDQEHRAFDEGFRSGINNPDAGCPYLNELREVWLIGHSVGVIVGKDK